MHAGFSALRRDCPMNLKRKRKGELSAEAREDVRRIAEMWCDARRRFGTGGEFLFGAFSAADCMYAPVATRFVSYEIEADPTCAAYIAAIYRLPAFRQWREAALAESWDYPATDNVA
jgi:glutathione S-transferase